ncbi:MAG: hypothetical protein H6716_28200 [Polyangiaceae bacterium]|nr:hypothetical protein [Polyangiaceae bacterium]
MPEEPSATAHEALPPELLGVFPKLPDHFFQEPNREYWQRELDVTRMQDILNYAEKSPAKAWERMQRFYTGPVTGLAFRSVFGFPAEDVGARKQVFTELGLPEEVWVYPALHLLLIERFIHNKSVAALREMLDIHLTATVPALIRDKEVDRVAAALLLYARAPGLLNHAHALSRLFLVQPSQYRFEIKGDKRPLPSGWQAGFSSRGRLQEVIDKWCKRYSSRVQQTVSALFTQPDGSVVFSLTAPTRPGAVLGDQGITEASQIRRAIFRFASDGLLRITTSGHISMAKLASHIAKEWWHSEGRYRADETPASTDNIIALVHALLQNEDEFMTLRSITYEARQVEEAPLTRHVRQGIEPMGETLKKLGDPKLLEYPDAIREIVVGLEGRPVRLLFPLPGDRRVLRFATKLGDRQREDLHAHVNETYGILLASAKSGTRTKRDERRRSRVELATTWLVDGVERQSPTEQEMEWLTTQTSGAEPLISIERSRYVRCSDPHYSSGEQEEICNELILLDGTSGAWEETGADRGRDVSTDELQCPHGHSRKESQLKWRRPVFKVKVSLNQDAARGVVEQAVAHLKGMQTGAYWTLPGEEQKLIAVARTADDPVLEILKGRRSEVAGIAIVWTGPTSEAAKARSFFPENIVLFGDFFLDRHKALHATLKNDPDKVVPLAAGVDDKRVVITSDSDYVYVGEDEKTGEPRRLNRRKGTLPHQVAWLLAQRLQEAPTGQSPQGMTFAKMAKQLTSSPAEPVDPDAVKRAVSRLKVEYLARALPKVWPKSEREAGLLVVGVTVRLNPKFFRIEHLHGGAPSKRR